MKTKKLAFFLLTVFTFSCATYKSQYSKNTDKNITYPADKTIDKTFYLIGDAGEPQDDLSDGLKGLKLALKTASKDDYVIFLGDNIYPSGLPEKANKNRNQAEESLNDQLSALKGFEGKTIFIPGNHDWYSNGIVGLKREQKYIQKALNDKDSFLPQNGCGLEEVAVSENTHIIIIDSQWIIADWDKNPTINNDCPEVKTREDLYNAIEDVLSDNEDKTIVFLLHHPLLTHGPHAGNYLIKSQFIPIPVLGTLATQIRKNGGVSAQDRYNKRYNDMVNRITTLAKGADKVIFASGHEHSLQYNVKDKIHQIVSGSGSKESGTKLIEDAQFTYGKQGFARLDIFQDGSSWVRYYVYENGENKLAFQTEIHEPDVEKDFSGMPANFSEYKKASVYREEQTKKSGFYKSFWGDHYRNIYGIKVKAPVALLDTLYGGLTPLRKGGGHQSKTLRLQDKNGLTYTMRALEKSAVRFLQATVFKDNFIEEDFENTAPDRLLLDFYTAAHPYSSFVVAHMADAIGVYHTSPKLFYVPKQSTLGKYNDEYGDELYMIEIRVDDQNKNQENFGSPDDIENTQNLFERLRKDEKYIVDREAFIKARLFDMVLGDWDRHQDQWKWAEFKKDKDSIVFVPIPRDRDQAFSSFDGGFFSTLRFFIGPLKMFSKDHPTIKYPKQFNTEPMPLDRALLEGVDRGEWQKQAAYIQEYLTDEVIETAFLNMPEEVRNEKLATIITNVKGRRDNLQKIASEYVRILNKLVILSGTDKDDYFEITRSGKGETTIRAYRIKGGKKADKIIDQTYHKSSTKEIWVYGLDDDDVFEVKGSGKQPILVRIIGGQNNDTYIIENGKKIRVYDHKSLKNTITTNKGGRIILTNDYQTNLFDRTKGKNTTSTLIPALGFNPDDGVKIGLNYMATHNGFIRNPFTSKHTLGGSVFLATNGVEFQYKGEFANVFGEASLVIGARATSQNFARNFFGFGSDTENFDDDLGLDFNRVKIGQLGANIGFKQVSKYGSIYNGFIALEGYEVENTDGRFISDFALVSPVSFEQVFFGTAELGYSYKSYDFPLVPSRGFSFDIKAGYTVNLEDTGRSFGYIKPAITFFNRLTNNGKLVLKTSASSHLIFSDDFEFYQAAVLGSNTGLRGYRNERFSGEKSLVFNGDLRYSFNQFKTSFIPLQIGIFGGYDYGRVWFDNDPDDEWQDSVGGGIWINSLNVINANFGLFNSDDGLRFSFVAGFKF